MKYLYLHTRYNLLMSEVEILPFEYFTYCALFMVPHNHKYIGLRIAIFQIIYRRDQYVR